MSSVSSSDVEIFNRSKLRKKIENDTLRPPEHLGKGGPDLHYFLLGDDGFTLKPWMVKSYCRRRLTSGENSKLQDLKRQWGGG